jgi:glycosyl-4,4'-diaponeurosporenoate acyltransferase
MSIESYTFHMEKIESLETMQELQELNEESPPLWLKEKVQKSIDTYFDPKEFEKDPEFYEKFGIRFFKKYLPTSGDIVSNLVWKKVFRENFVNKNLKSVEGMIAATKVYEMIHIALFAVFAMSIGNELAQGSFGDAATSTALNTIVNVYPIMLQRYNRGRLTKVQKKMTEQKNPASDPIT